jgi:hypothetical protein
VDDALERLSPRGEVFGVVADVSKLEQARALVAAVEQRSRVSIFSSIMRAWECSAPSPTSTPRNGSA